MPGSQALYDTLSLIFGFDLYVAVIVTVPGFFEVICPSFETETMEGLLDFHLKFRWLTT